MEWSEKSLPSREITRENLPDSIKTAMVVARLEGNENSFDTSTGQETWLIDERNLRSCGDTSEYLGGHD